MNRILFAMALIFLASVSGCQEAERGINGDSTLGSSKFPEIMVGAWVAEINDKAKTCFSFIDVMTNIFNIFADNLTYQRQIRFASCPS